MDTLGAMVFGIVIVNAARSRGVSSAKLLTRYTVLAGLIAGMGLTLVYLSLFRLGSVSGELVPHAQNGAEILHAYVQHLWQHGQRLPGVAHLHRLSGDGRRPDLRLRRVLRPVPAALLPHPGVAAGRLLHAGFEPGAEPLDPAFGAGADRHLSPCIVLVVLSFTLRWWGNGTRVVGPVMLISLLFGLIDGLKASALAGLLPAWASLCP